MVGFQNQTLNDGIFKCFKPENKIFNSMGPPKIKRKNKADSKVEKVDETSNPWANLDSTGPGNTINEKDLMDKSD